jgi:homoserine O-acetyltransferase
MTLKYFRAAFSLSLSLVSGAVLACPALAQSHGTKAADARPWDQGVNPAAVQADAWFDNYKFRNGDALRRLKIHYVTLGAPHRNSEGAVDNAVLVLH